MTPISRTCTCWNTGLENSGVNATSRVTNTLLRRLDDRQFHIAGQPIVMVNQGEVDFDALLYCGLKEPLSHTVPIVLGGQLLPDLGQIVLAIGLLDVREQPGAFARQRQAASEEVPG